jgi:adhesin transport system outer membrane protein
MILRNLLLGTALAGALIGVPGVASALSLKEAVVLAVKTNPEIGQAIENREAVEFELKQALSLYGPRVDLEASVGAQMLNNVDRRAAGIQNDPLYPAQIGVVASYDILDGGFRQSEANRQAARIDGASFRVLERSEFIGLEIAREYFEILLQGRIVELAKQNVAFHSETLANVGEAISSGKLTEADRQQATERVAAARARVSEATEALETARIGFFKLVGVPFENANLPKHVKGLPKTLDAAIELGRHSNPRIGMAGADINAASSLVDQAQGALGPKLTLEGRGTVGYDSLGNNSLGSGSVTSDDHLTDLQGRLVLKFNIYDGGAKSAAVQENIRRETEAMLAQQQAFREVDEAVRVSWQRIRRQNELAALYGEQRAASNNLVASYRDQFTIGQRSLLDVLDAQNTRFNVQVLSETADYAARFAEFRLLASTGKLLAYLNIDAPNQGVAYARELLQSPDTTAENLKARKPLNLSAPLDLTSFVN